MDTVYKNLFSNALTSSPGAPSSLSVLNNSDYYYYITSYTSNGGFKSVSISVSGIITYVLNDNSSKNHENIIYVTLLIK